WEAAELRGPVFRKLFQDWENSDPNKPFDDAGDATTPLPADLLGALGATPSRPVSTGIGGTGDVITLELKPALGGAQFELVNRAAVAGGRIVLPEEVGGEAFKTSGLLYFIPEPGTSPADQDPASPGFQGEVVIPVRVDGRASDVRFRVTAGYSFTGLNRVALQAPAAFGSNRLDVYRVQQRLRFLGFPGRAGHALTVNGTLDEETKWALGLFG